MNISRIQAQRAHVIHCHTQMVAWAQNTRPELLTLRTMAVAHYARHKERALQTLKALIASN